MSRTPYPEVTELICRVPSPQLRRHAVDYSSRGTCVGSRYGHHGCKQAPFHWHEESSKAGFRPPTRAFANFSPLRLYICIDTWTDRRVCSKYPHASALAQRLRWCRNIDLLPFRHSRLRNDLGSTNPRLMNIVEEPWPLRRSGFPPLFAATPTMILIRTRSTRCHHRTSARARRPTTESPFGVPRYRWLA